MGVVTLFFLIAEVAVFKKSSLSDSEKTFAGLILISLVSISILTIMMVKVPSLEQIQAKAHKISQYLQHKEVSSKNNFQVTPKILDSSVVISSVEMRTADGK
jgi:hypothetical protein